MPHVWIATVVTVVVVASSGCSDAQPASESQPRSSQSSRAPRVVVEGSSASLPMHGGGSLHIRVTVRRGQTDLESIVLSAERERCELEPTSGGDSVIACHRSWRETRKLARTEYSLDAQLSEARVHARFRGHRLSLLWRAATPRREQAGVPGDGYVLLQSADAVSGGSWGRVRWRMPSSYDPDRNAGTTLYRRVVSWA